MTGDGITLTASASLFTSSYVGAHFKLSQLINSEYDEWQTSTTYHINDIVVYDGNVYQSSTNTSSGTRPPVHTSGTQSDGNIDWTYLHSGSGYAVVTAYTNATQVTANVVSRLPEDATSGTTQWAEGSWSTVQGYPRTAIFHEGRLWFGGTTNQPQTIWGCLLYTSDAADE